MPTYHFGRSEAQEIKKDNGCIHLLKETQKLSLNFKSWLPCHWTFQNIRKNPLFWPLTFLGFIVIIRIMRVSASSSLTWLPHVLLASNIEVLTYNRVLERGPKVKNAFHNNYASSNFSSRNCRGYHNGCSKPS